MSFSLTTNVKYVSPLVQAHTDNLNVSSFEKQKIYASFYLALLKKYISAVNASPVGLPKS